MSRKTPRGEPDTDRHHLIPQFNRDLFNVFESVNIKRIKRKTHNAIHTLFLEQHPQKQLETWLHLHEDILSHEAKQRLKEIIALELKRFYHKELIK